MNQWIDTKTFAAKIFRSERSAKRILMERKYKGTPLQVQQGKSTRGGKPPYFVLWDTELNQPATLTATGENNEYFDRQRFSGILQKTTENVEELSAVRNGAGQAGSFATHSNVRKFDSKSTDDLDCSRLNDLEPTSSIHLANKDVSTFLSNSTPGDNYVFTVAKNEHSNQSGPGKSSERDVGTVCNSTVTGSAGDTVQEPSASYESTTRTTEQNSNLSAETQTALFQTETSNQCSVRQHNISEDGEELHPENFTCQFDYVERLIESKNKVKTESAARAYRSSTLKEWFDSLTIPSDLHAQWHSFSQLTAIAKFKKHAEFAQKHKLSGSIPLYLSIEAESSGKKKAKSLTGRKSTVPDEIADYLEQMVRNESDPEHDDCIATRRRKLENYQREIYLKFNQQIPTYKLATVLKKREAYHLLKLQIEQGNVVKKRGYWKKYNPAELILMDGCVPEGIEILNEKGTDFRTFRFIGLYDVGCHMFLTLRAYYSESAENSIHLVRWMLQEVQFVQGTSDQLAITTIRPDNAPGFNLNRVCQELSNRNELINHFQLLHIPAKSNTPGDKVQQEATHNGIHSKLVDWICREFKHLREGKPFKKKIFKEGRQGVVIMAERLKITLDDINNSRALADYLKWNRETLTTAEENGETSEPFIPLDRWNAYLQSGQTFNFKQEDIDALEIYGNVEKAGERTVQTGGMISHDSKKYQIKDSRYANALVDKKVRITQIRKGEAIAIYKLEKDGVYLCNADWVGNEKPNEEKVKKVRAKTAEASKKQTKNADVFDLEKRIIEICGYCNSDDVAVLLKDGATIANMSDILTTNEADYTAQKQKYSGNPMFKDLVFMIYAGKVKSTLTLSINTTATGG